MSEKLTLPPQAELRRLLSYDPETGIVRWRIDVNRSHAKAGDEAGSPRRNGYRRIIIGRRSYATHRLIWKLVTGKDPKEEIDHINRSRSDNRWGNLREATPAQNTRNKTPYRRSAQLPTGIYPSKNGDRFRARLSIGRKTVGVGTFNTIEEAVIARAALLKKETQHV